MLDDALKTRIDNEIASESVVLFMKGTPVEMPWWLNFQLTIQEIRL